MQQELEYMRLWNRASTAAIIVDASLEQGEYSRNYSRCMANEEIISRTFARREAMASPVTIVYFQVTVFDTLTLRHAMA